MVYLEYALARCCITRSFPSRILLCSSLCPSLVFQALPFGMIGRTLYVWNMVIMLPGVVSVRTLPLSLLHRLIIRSSPHCNCCEFEMPRSVCALWAQHSSTSRLHLFYPFSLRVLTRKTLYFSIPCNTLSRGRSPGVIKLRSEWRHFFFKTCLHACAQCGERSFNSKSHTWLV